MISFFPSRTVAVELFGFGVHWYGLLYFASFLIAWFLINRLQHYRNLSLTKDEWSSLLSAAVIGVIAGGRLGYVFFYAPFYYLQHPLEIFAVWNGGMASHGGFIGVTLAMLYVLRKKSRDEILRIADITVIPVTIGLGLGRIGNFINQELYGTVTRLPWGMTFSGAEGYRHPIQLYDFAAMMMVAFFLYLSLTPKPPTSALASTLRLWATGDKPAGRQSYRSGRTLALFLILYGIVRFFIEFIRENNGVFFWGLSEGQWLTIPLLYIGFSLYTKTRKLIEK